MNNSSNASVSQSPETPPGVPILEDSAWSDPGCSWDDSAGDAPSGEATADPDIFFVPAPRRELPSSRILRSWLRLRWQLSRKLFSVPVYFFTAEFGVRVGDVVVTFPLVFALTLISAVQAANCDVKGSGVPPSIALATVFAFTVRNNSLLVVFTGISFERALFYHKLFAFVMIILTSLHGLAYILARRDGKMKPNPKIVSGMLAFIAMLVLYLLSLECIRRRFHEFFVRTHWIIFIVILVAALLHGGVIALVGVLPWEIDMVFRLIYRARIYSNGTLCGRKPRSLINDLYMGDSATTSAKKSKQRLGVAAQDQLEVFQLPDDITCIQFPRVRLDTGEEFKYKAGQYAFLCVPTLASFEWHPFSFSSSPHEDLVRFHIKAVGDWTMTLLQAAPEARNERENPFKILIDGPYGNLSIDIEDSAAYSHFVFFAGGMGVTPMRAIANWLHNQCYFQKARILHRLRFVWSVSDSESLRALMNLEAERWINNPRAPYLPDVLLCPTTLNVFSETFFTEIYLTRGLVGSQAPLDPQLSKCLWFNCRPDIEQILREMGRQATKHGSPRVAVLVCGPESMTTEIIDTSVRLSQEMNLHFDVHRERFAL
ncbi:hypothetical protein PHYPSEUDO_015108 [Phytophthora pseudosyringae]|uniref:FAD-binding FR-type domain-containing protein n=1 Tax=Phytophthora pseudosyringae TaxID=221518 RepID=A0A8T1W465_9STRA|nr:hypothetical protein PHYPSEUDO_015108 [Phytophthora pseudosyringae]